MGNEQLVPSGATHQAAAFGPLEQRDLEMGVRWISDAMTGEEAGAPISQQIKFFGHLNADPLGQSEMAYDQLLPFRFLSQLVTEPRGDRDRREEPFPLCQTDGNSQKRRGVTPTGKAHKARRTEQAGEENRLHGGYRTLDLGRLGPVRITVDRAEDHATGQVDPVKCNVDHLAG
jgi:hypothetical protein